MLLFFVLINFKTEAQTSQTQYFLPQPFPRSPTATALEKYGSYQVNEFTGIPDISIPLYTIEAGGFQIPITLSYHASGNKVTDVASWVGLGWSLSTGGQITRRVYGLPDDGPEGYLEGLMHASGTINPSADVDIYYLESAANGTYDTKPDIYSYDFPGHSGKFFFDGSAGNGTYPIRTIPYAPLKIKPGFTITDEHGNIYSYGGAGTDSTSSATGGKTAITTQSAWKIKSMISQNRRDTISFSYNTNSIKYPAADGEIYTVTDNIEIPCTAGTGFYSASYGNAPSTPGNLNLTAEKVPAQINYKNGRVVFDRDDTVRRDVTYGDLAYGLKDIKIYNYNYGSKTMELQKTIVFWKSYFNPSTGHDRLRLDSIQVLDKAGSVIQHYNFDYNTSVALPDYTSKKQDYWGYFNGVDNSELTPQLSIPYQSCSSCTSTYVTIGSDHTNGRDCDSTKMQAFVLTGIHYPTGGYSTFTYQTNQYTDTGVTHLAGGLRIKTISSYEHAGATPIVKTYVYNTARPNFNLSNYYFSTAQTHRDWQNCSVGGQATVVATARIRTFCSNPHTDLEGFDGSTVVYPSVTEYIGTPASNAGRMDYVFSDAIDTLLMASMAGQQVYANAFYRRGHLLTKSEYINAGSGTYQLAKATTNAYTALPPSKYPNVGLAVFKNFYNEGQGVNPQFSTDLPDDDRASGTYTYQYYNISSDDNYLTGTTTKIYDINNATNYTTSYEYYTYDDTTHQQIVSTTHVDSKGNTHISSNKYAYNYLNGGTTTNNAVLDSMISRHMYAEPVEKWDSLRNITTGVNAVVGAQLNFYTAGYSSAVVPSKISTLSVTQPLTSFTHSSVVSGTLTGDSHYVQMISFDQYDSNNNITQYTARNATPTSIIWDYLHGNPIAQVKNAVNTAVLYTSFDADGKGGWFYSGTPVFDPTAPTGSMVYPLSSGSISSPGLSTTTGYIVSYWSNSGPATVYASGYISGTSYRSANGWAYYEHIIPTGVSAVTISGSTSIDELRLYPPAAQMTTYAYNPSGVTSISDTKGAINSFEYDYFGRLKNAKDWNGNIVKNYGYHTYDQTYGNQVQSASFTRNNCPSGTTPQSLTYTVPANRYYSSTLASANADATYEMNVNGQIKANQVCGCPVASINVSVTNSSGISGFPITFSGISTYYVPTGTSNISVPQGTYSSVQVGPYGSGTHNFTMGTRATQYGVHYATFSSVVIATGSSDLTISIN